MITLALTAFAALLGLLLVRLPIGLSLLAVGAAGIAFIRPQAVLPTISGELITISTNYALTIIPLFILMGNLAGKSGMSRELFDAAQSFIGHKRSGLASATIIGSAGFSALSGSSLAATLTMGTVALPQMRRFGYHDGLSTGAIAAGGTLGILIPPSAGMIIYATLTETSVGRLFIAGILPGLLLSTLFVLAIFLIVRHDPAKAPKQPAPAPWAACVAAFARAKSFLLIVTVSIGGIYTGIFSPIEAAGIGSSLTLIAAIMRRSLALRDVVDVVSSTLETTGKLLLILFGAFVFKAFIGFTGLVYDLALWVEAQDISAMTIVLATLLVCVVLGTFLEGLAIMILVVPVIQPIIEPLGIDMIWFGILMIIVLEMALISPPIGLNVMIVSGIAPDVPLSQIYAGVLPFWFAMIVAAVLILLLPQIALVLPNMMF